MDLATATVPGKPGGRKAMNATAEITPAGFRTWNCPLCESGTSKTFLSAPDMNLGINGVFRYVRCENCGLVRQYPAPGPDVLPTLYPKLYGAGGGDDDKAMAERIDSRFNRIRRQTLERAGAMVTANVEPGAIVAGVPARLIRRIHPLSSDKNA